MSDFKRKNNFLRGTLYIISTGFLIFFFFDFQSQKRTEILHDVVKEPVKIHKFDHPFSQAAKDKKLSSITSEECRKKIKEEAGLNQCDVLCASKVVGETDPDLAAFMREGWVDQKKHPANVGSTLGLVLESLEMIGHSSGWRAIKKDPQQAEQNMASLYKRDPRNAFSAQFYAFVLFKNGKKQEAAKVLNDVVKNGYYRSYFTDYVRRAILASQADPKIKFRTSAAISLPSIPDTSGLHVLGEVAPEAYREINRMIVDQAIRLNGRYMDVGWSGIEYSEARDYLMNNPASAEDQSIPEERILAETTGPLEEQKEERHSGCTARDMHLNLKEKIEDYKRTKFL